MTEPTSDEVVWVRRHWNDWRRAKYSRADVQNLRWDFVSGGARSRAPQAFIHGYVACDGALEGEVAHSAIHGECPHRIKVVIVAKDNLPSLMNALRTLVGPKP